MPRARFRNPESIVPYNFGGNELYTDSGLNLYDFKARMYDPTIGHFTSIDPKAEKYFSITPYAYCNNNPVIFVDSDGRVKLNALIHKPDVNRSRKYSSGNLRAFNNDLAIYKSNSGLAHKAESV